LTTVKNGTATVLAGQTAVTVPHALGFTPALKEISLQPQDDLGARDYWPSSPDATNFQINISGMDADQNHIFTWTIITEGFVPGTVAYCTNDNVKAYSKIAYSDLGYATDDLFKTFLDSLIILAEGVIDNYCSVPTEFFAPDGKAFTNKLHDYRYPWIDLRYYPVLSVSKVEYNDQGYGIAPNWVTLDSVDYIINLDTAQLMLVNKVPATPEQSVRVSYTAGYSAVPSVIQHVCIQICSNMLHEILQRKLAPVVRVDDLTLKVLVPEAFTKELQVMLAHYVRKMVACG
jgi:hypothetical protein